jgi:hypothetical protein
MTHSFEIQVDYQRCPDCGFIIEDRKKYNYKMGKVQKKVHCDRCCKDFVIERGVKPTFGPLLGDLTSKPEVDWV